MVFNTAVDWTLRINDARYAYKISNPDGSEDFVPIKPIESDWVFTSPVIGVYIDSDSAPQNWYAAGDLYQALLVPFGVGYAQGELYKPALRRYRVFKFSKFNSESYLLSFTPRYYIHDISLKVWEFSGDAGPSLNSLESTINVLRRDTNVNTKELKELTKKISRLGQ
jgi:hypothetical protein